MTTNLTEDQLMSLINELTEQSGAVLTFLLTSGKMNNSALARVTEVRFKLLAIAKEYERRGKERDELLEGVKVIRDMQNCYNTDSNHLNNINSLARKLILVCEGKE